MFALSLAKDRAPTETAHALGIGSDGFDDARTNLPKPVPIAPMLESESWTNGSVCFWRMDYLDIVTPYAKSKRNRVGDFEVTVAPIDDYAEIAQRLANTHGVEPTALVCIQAPPPGKCRCKPSASI